MQGGCSELRYLNRGGVFLRSFLDRIFPCNYRIRHLTAVIHGLRYCECPLPTVISRAVGGAFLCAGLVTSAALYTCQLDRVPAYLTLDEAHFSVHAASLAATGRNLNGQILPPLISLDDPEGEPFNLPWGETYYLSFGFYLIAGALQVLPLTEAAVRMPSALLGGAINVALIFVASLLLFRSRLAAAASAMVLALAPANVIISRQALDSVCQPLFVLGGLCCLGAYLRKPDPRLALAAGLILGSGIYAYVTSVVFMPFYLALFWLVGWRASARDRPFDVARGKRAVLYSIGGFALALLPMALWLVAHPEAARSLQIQYNRADPGSATLMQTLASHGVARALGETLHIYWSYFDPTFLFIQGGNARTLSTGEAGVFLFPVAVLAPIGVAALGRNRPVRLLILAGLFAAPLPAVIKGAPYAIQRASGLLIFISLLAGAGLAFLAMSNRAIARASAAIVVALMAWQFAGFYRDYHTTYRLRSAQAYDATAFRDVAALVIDGDRERAVDAVYMPTNFYDAGAKWRFYTHKHDRASLWRRTTYFSDPAALAAAPPRTIAVLPAPATPPAGWTTIGVATSLGGEPTATVIRRE